MKRHRHLFKQLPAVIERLPTVQTSHSNGRTPFPHPSPFAVPKHLLKQSRINNQRHQPLPSFPLSYLSPLSTHLTSHSAASQPPSVTSLNDTACPRAAGIPIEAHIAMVMAEETHYFLFEASQHKQLTHTHTDLLSLFICVEIEAETRAKPKSGRHPERDWRMCWRGSGSEAWDIFMEAKDCV